MARQNLALQSKHFANVAWSAAHAGDTRTDNVVASPDGITGAQIDFAVTTSYVYQAYTLPSSGLPRTFTWSVWLYSPTKATIGLQLYSSLTAGGSVITASNKTITLTAGWTRYSVTHTSAASALVLNFGLDNRVGQGGDGIAGTVYAWQGQLVQANWEGDPVETTSAAVGVNTPPQNMVSLGGQNLVRWSEDFSNAVYTNTNVTVVANQSTAPDGTNTMDQIVGNTTNGQHRIYQQPTVAIGRMHTFSVHAKAGTKNWLRLQLNDNSALAVDFDLTNGVVGTVGASIVGYDMKQAANGSWRCFITAMVLSAPAFSLDMLNGNNVDSYAGTTADTINVWGYQVVQANWAGDYTKTGASAVGVNAPPPNMARPVNLCLWSEDQSNAAWTKGVGVTATANTTDVADPIGGSAATKLVYDGSGGTGTFKLVQNTLLQSRSIGDVASAGIWLRLATGSRVLQIQDNYSNSFTSITVDTTWRFFQPRRLPATGINALLVAVYDGAGLSSGFTMYSWGGQANRGSLLSPYAKTGATAVGSGEVCASGMVAAGQNLVLFSEDFSNAAWTSDQGGTGVLPVTTPNFATAPDGSGKTATRLQFDKGVGVGFSRLQQTVSVPVGLRTYTNAIWIKTNDGTTKVIGLRVGSAVGATITATPTWQRLPAIPQAITDGTGNFQLLLWSSLNTDQTADLSVWGASMNVGTRMGPYVKTVGAAVDNGGAFGMVPTGQNLLVQSSDISAPGWTVIQGFTVSPNQAADPVTGALTADLLVEDNSNGLHQIGQTLTMTPLVGKVYTFSICIKAAARGFAQIQINGSAAANVGIDLTTGATAMAGSALAGGAEPLPNGNWRCWVTKIVDSGTTFPAIAQSALSLTGGATSYQGVAGTGAIYVSNAQLVQGYGPGDICPTLAVPVDSGPLQRAA